MQDLKTAIIQCELLWENVPGNLARFDKIISDIKEAVDIIILPEMFNTAFSMNPAACAEKTDGLSMQWLKEKAKERNCVIVGSILINEGERFYNRLTWMFPDGTYQCYDKKHLFRFSGEHEVFTAGNKIITPALKGWNFRPFVCYDLRFPVWSMNTYSNEKFGYDCLLYVANWAEKRREAWMKLLVSRAIENQSYVIGVNRVGTDGKGVTFSGDSMVVNPKGEIIIQIPAHKEATEIVTLSFNELQSYRDQFRVALDWDKFTVEG